MKRVFPWLVLAALIVSAWWLYRLRSHPGGAASAQVSVETLLARERAAAHFEAGDFARARAELAPLVALADAGGDPRGDAELDDLVRAMLVDYAERPKSDPEPLLARLEQRDPAHPTLHYVRARLALERGDFAAAVEHFERAAERAPDDAATLAGLASAYLDVDRASSAAPLLTRVIDLGPERAGAWYVLAVYLSMRLAQDTGDEEEGRRLQRVYTSFEAQGFRAPNAKELDFGELAKFPRAAPSGILDAPAPRAPQFALEPAVLPEFANARELCADDLDGDGDFDLLAASERGVLAAFQQAGEWTVETVLAGPVDHVRAYDLANRDVQDLVVVRGAEVLLFEHASGADLLLGDPNAPRWKPAPLALPSLAQPFGGAVADLLAVDFDHEGDLDLLFVGAFGARLWRNDAAVVRPSASGVPGEVARGGFTDVSTDASLPSSGALAWCATEDFDGDADVDLLLGGPGALHLMDNQRAGRFVDVAARRFTGLRAFDREPELADFDADGRVDVLVLAQPNGLLRQRDDGTFAAADARLPRTLVAPATARAADLDLDGVTDLVVSGAEAVFVAELGFGTPIAAPFAFAGRGEPAAPWLVIDLDRDLDQDFVRATASGIEIARGSSGAGRAARLAPSGLKDNRRALGAIVETRTAGRYRRIYWRGVPELVGCGANDALDVLRTTWPNGAVQTALAVPPTDRPFVDAPSGALVQPEGLIGSCPFLYAWNGETYGFVSDVLGGTPLGLPMAPGMLVPPDHDEYVLVRGSELVPKGGHLELQFTEELREVTYLDRARLDVVDHPADVAIYPNERFCFPPFPEAHVHTVKAPLAPLRALGSDGRDWAQELGARDDVHAMPFTPLAPQFLGLATPHWLELEFDAAKTRDARKLRLVCTGWFYWTDASVNVASARTPDVRFVPPILQVQGPDGTWRDAAPPLGFPAGKSKTMVIELDGLVDVARPKFRLFSTLRLYWDAVELAVCDDAAETRVTALEPRSAKLWPRGFSRPIATERKDLPERFEWDALSDVPRWNQHPGLYTRYGETVELLGSADDRFVILGSGDALTLRFDASSLPPLADGWTRDYLLYLDGWAKDRDPNTIEALTVEPLPFHAMSGYPYGPDEHFPTTPAHAAWRTEWNTRPARKWLAPLSPAASSAWLKDALLSEGTAN
ncbi:MAG: FG-GAP-like repeat-containing protein [Planctomycetes bacterium]|nr:FG-GAP-like repeat-containing protein [Planctomycetota bacterium]